MLCLRFSRPFQGPEPWCAAPPGAKFADDPLFVACGTEPAACTMANMIVANASGQFQVGDPQATHIPKRSSRIRLP
jgi:hypothetical protein